MGTVKLTSPKGVDLKGKLVQLRQEFFSPGLRAIDHRLRCLDGFGCSPCSMGRKVFGTFEDGGETLVLREDIEFVVEETDDDEVA